MWLFFAVSCYVFWGYLMVSGDGARKLCYTTLSREEAESAVHSSRGPWSLPDVLSDTRVVTWRSGQRLIAWTCSSSGVVGAQKWPWLWCHNDIFLSLRHAVVINHFDSILSRVCMRILDACARISARLSGSWAQNQIYAPDGCYRRGRSLTVASFFLFSTPLQWFRFVLLRCILAKSRCERIFMWLSRWLRGLYCSLILKWILGEWSGRVASKTLVSTLAGTACHSLCWGNSWSTSTYWASQEWRWRSGQWGGVVFECIAAIRGCQHWWFVWFVLWELNCL